jgi:curved DNA-binding protein CbpA
MKAHEILGVPETATPEEIKAAYKKLASEHHPDKEGGDAEKFRIIREAYEELSGNGPKKKSELDLVAEERFMGLIRGAIVNPRDPEQSLFITRDKETLIQIMTRRMTKTRRAVNSRLKEDVKKLKELEDLRGRVKFSGEGESLFDVVLENEIAKVQNMIADDELEILTIDRVAEMLTEYFENPELGDWREDDEIMFIEGDH